MLDPVFANRLIRREWSRVVGTAMRILGDLDRAEDVAQFALLRAVERWPADGVPRNPGAWLTTVARRRALNLLRNEAKRSAIDDVDALPGDEAALDLDALPDDRLTLMVLCCHPALSHTSQVALILRLAGGLSTTEIGRAYVTPSATVGQRIARAKATLREAGARFEMPDPTELEQRLSPVLEAIYLVFNEGYAAGSPAATRAELMESAQMLAATLTEVAPAQPEVWGLASLLTLQASRTSARHDAEGEVVPLDEQDRSRWDRRAIAAGERCRAAGQAAARASGRPVGPYMLQAEIAAVHARAETWPDTDWAAIDRLYGALGRATNNPVVALNHAVARSFAESPAAGLALLDTLEAGGTLRTYGLVTVARADMLRRARRFDAAAVAYEAAARDAQDPRERALYERRRAECLAAR